MEEVRNWQDDFKNIKKPLGNYFSKWGLSLGPA